MLLALKPEQQPGYGNPHAYSPAHRSPSSYYATPPTSAALPVLPALPDTRPPRMSTPHRGLPPPSAMERMLPTPERAPASGVLPLGSLPAAPTQWQGQDESMRSWLHAKSEEDRRKQEEEKTKQEGLRLDQRRIEQNMLQESLRGGIPPPMIPMVFASIGGGNVANQSVEWAQHYMAQISLQQQAQMQQQQQQVQQQQQPQLQQPQLIQNSSPEQRRDRLIAGPQPNPYGAQQMQPPPQTPQAGPPNQPGTGFAPSYPGSALAAERTRVQQPTLHAAPPTSNPRSQSQPAGLSRLNTGDLLVQQPNHSSSATQHPLQQSQTAADHASSSPTLYFHHYVPPGAQERQKDKEHGTPSGKSQHTSPYAQTPGSHLRSEYTTSPKKRKATGPPHGAPDPSPSFSHRPSSGSNSGSGRRRRSRQRSDASSRALPHDYPARQRTDSNRQSLSEGGSSSRNSAQPETRPPPQAPPRDDRNEMRQLSRPLMDSDRHHSPKREVQPSLTSS